MRKPWLKVGDKVGEWTLKAYHPGKHRKDADGKTIERSLAMWDCVCSCGEERKVKNDNLTCGLTFSCGHGRREKFARL